MQLYEMTLHRLSEMLADKLISSKELTQSVLERIQSLDSKLNAFITVDSNGALKQAESVDNKRLKGDSLCVIAGIPIGLKDNICLKNMRTTCGSKMLENYISPYNATVAQKLLAADAVIVGKLNMDEFAMGSSTENSYFGVTRNPYDITKVAGGSSGGCAAAVSCGEVIAALGSDTGGSVRQPASFCGVVGLKPTYGSVSRYGLVAFASSLDQIGPVCKCVKDTAIMYSAVVGGDKLDMTSQNKEYPNFEVGQKDLKGLRIGLPVDMYENITEPDVLERFENAIRLLEKNGARIRRISIAETGYALPAYYVISSAEASSNLARFDGVRYGFRAQNIQSIDELFVKTRSQGFGDECKRRIMLGTSVLSEGYYDEYYSKAVKAAKMMTHNVKQLFESVDIIATPTCAETAFDIGKKVDDPVKMYNSDIFTVLANLTGVPAISVPCGCAGNGLPVGIQLMADSFCEQTLFDAAYWLESLVNAPERGCEDV